MKTFDGKTFFVPNRQILNDIVINYHFTQTRRLKIDVNIRYDQDLLKAKRVLEAIMTEDPRVKDQARAPWCMCSTWPVTVLWNWGGAAGWTTKDYWVARCDLLEKTKLRFDSEGHPIRLPAAGSAHQS
jgi:small conductance mechanosensitive channel